MTATEQDVSPTDRHAVYVWDQLWSVSFVYRVSFTDGARWIRHANLTANASLELACIFQIIIVESIIQGSYHAAMLNIDCVNSHFLGYRGGTSWFIVFARHIFLVFRFLPFSAFSDCLPINTIFPSESCLLLLTPSLISEHFSPIIRHASVGSFISIPLCAYAAFFYRFIHIARSSVHYKLFHLYENDKHTYLLTCLWFVGATKILSSFVYDLAPPSSSHNSLLSLWYHSSYCIIILSQAFFSQQSHLSDIIPHTV